ncbi:OST-HTH/LOTUS domain-containing protein [Thiocystis violacea]|uniref:OST-HTH/LOTUS domain-containing protein n=1 Tax=Thiocystis violacea TaxID=13725 RepID=UPI001F5B7902|nr:OST-HTH/LOTUS domain-containing protein [Thiocystis violacea]
MNDEDLQAQQREVQRLLGRCLLRLQQYERLMKGIVVHHDISGPADELESIRAARVNDASTKTLGTLVGRLFGSCVVTEGADTAADDTASAPVDVIHFAMRMQLSLSAEDYVRTQNDLRELVQLRNNLVHHFIDQHDLWSIDGCRAAHDALVAACERIGKHFEQPRGWVRHMDQARQLSAEFLQSDAGYDVVFNGIFPDGTVNWPAAGIVRALREAANALAVDGWTPVAAAGRWITERSPEQQPKKYGCASWRQVLHESRLFELRYRDVDGQRAACYRVRAE